MNVVRVRDLTPAARIPYHYVMRWIRTPDRGSMFDRHTRFIRWLWDPVLFRLLRTFQYDGLLFMDEVGTVRGHVFFQRRNAELYIFSVFVRKADRGHNFSSYMLQKLHPFAAVDGIKYVRLGSGGSASMQGICERIASRKSTLPYRPRENHPSSWLELA